jgi:adiponectin receptor
MDASSCSPDRPLTAHPTTQCAQAETLLLHKEMPAWFRSRVSTTIVLGYRPAERPLLYYIRSTAWLSNETINVWSHLSGALIFLVLLALCDDPFLATYNCAAALCFAISASFHVLMPYSDKVYDRMQRLDYAAIFVLIGISAVPWYTIELNCHAELQLAAVASTAVLMLLLACLVGTQSWFGKDTPRGKALRVLAFGSFGAACVGFGGASALLGFKPEPYLRAEPLMMPGLLAVTGVYVAGPVLYALDWPEKRHPRVFDLFGASHQLMHVCVLVAALMHGWCMQRARELRPVVAPCEGE